MNIHHDPAIAPLDSIGNENDAHILANEIRRYWLGKIGHVPKVRVVREKGGKGISALWCIRSDMVGGWPIGKHKS